MPITPPLQRPGERGSVLIYIFIAIIVLAALTFAVSRSNREGLATVDRERSELQATQILDYTGMIRRSVQAMKVAGIADTELCFHHALWGYAAYNHAACATEAHQVFLPSGGGSAFQRPGEALMDGPLSVRARDSVQAALSRLDAGLSPRPKETSHGARHRRARVR